MDLGQDWDALNRTLYPRTKTKGSSESEFVFIAHHGDRVLRMVGDRDELLFTTGAPVSEALNAVGSQYTSVAIDIAEMNRALGEVLKSEGAIYEQVQGLRDRVRPSHGELPELKDHFIFLALRSGWSRFLPSSYGIYLHLEGSDALEARSILLVFRKGKLHEFDEPDFSTLSLERRNDLDGMVKILRERYRVPVQGFAMNRADFEGWSESGDRPATWKKIARAMKQNRLSLHPFRFSVAALIGARGIF